MLDSKDDTSFFQVTTHKVETSYPREREFTIVDETKDTYLSVNQYVPKSNLQPSEGDITFIGASGLGMVKEIYEPLFEDLTRSLNHRGIGVRALWIADPLHMGKSAVHNVDNLGNDVSWWDHSRDLYLIIQKFRKEMPRPLVGIGHSMGGAQIAYVSILNPNVFESIILLEPAIYETLAGDSAALLGKMVSKRREAWPDLDSAVTSVKKNPFYKSWDPRITQRLIQNQFVPAAIAPSAELRHKLFTDSGAHATHQVATATPRLSEANMLFRSNKGDFVDRLTEVKGELLEPFDKARADTLYPFYQAGGMTMLKHIPYLRPEVLYIVGDKSTSSTPQMREQRMSLTGIGIGGSGGVAKGKVREHVIEGGDHYILFHKHHIKEVCTVAADHLQHIMEEYRQKMADKKRWQEQSSVVHQRLNPKLLAGLTEWNPKSKDKSDVTEILKSKL